MVCRICTNSDSNKTYLVKEMMFGLGDEFTYFECPACGCLQIAEMPQDMTRYYPDGYYSFHGALPESAARRLARISRDQYAVLGIGVIGRLLSRRYPNAPLQMLGAQKPSTEAAILVLSE